MHGLEATMPEYLTQLVVRGGPQTVQSNFFVLMLAQSQCPAVTVLLLEKMLIRVPLLK